MQFINVDGPSTIYGTKNANAISLNSLFYLTFPVILILAKYLYFGGNKVKINGPGILYY